MTARIPLTFQDIHFIALNSKVEIKDSVFILFFIRCQLFLGINNNEKFTTKKWEGESAAEGGNRRGWNAGYTIEEREVMTNYIEFGLIDTFRLQYPETAKYSWWSYRGQARAKNLGWRIDYFLTTAALESQIKSTEILTDVTGSDHCPVELHVGLTFAHELRQV